MLTRGGFLKRILPDILFIFYAFSVISVGLELYAQIDEGTTYLPEFSGVYLVLYSMFFPAHIFNPIRKTVYYLPLTVVVLFGGGLLVYPLYSWRSRTREKTREVI